MSRDPRDQRPIAERATAYDTNRFGECMAASETKRPSIRSRMKEFRRRITRSDRFIDALASLAKLVLVAHYRTLRVRTYMHPEVEKLAPSKVIYAFWHGRYYLLMSVLSKQGVVVLTDLSWAGEIQAKLLAKVGFLPVRGSTRRAAGQALARMKRAMEDGHAGGFALDGPTGPPLRTKPGILLLAKTLGCSIVPVGTSAARSWIVPNTWDRYLIPLPFSRCYVSFGAPVPGAAEGTITTEELDRIICEATDAADREVGRAPDGRPPVEPADPV